MNLEPLETAIRWLCGVLAYSILGILLISISRATQREAGLTIGRTGSWLRSPWFYLITSAIFFGVSFLGWIPLPLTVSSPVRAWMLLIGLLLYFPGILFLLWGRMALRNNYFVSTGFGAQLFKDHQLVSSGPFAIVRHPMYTGLILAALGSLLIYMTWTTLLFACFSPFTIMRAYQEERALSQMFGEQWRRYCRHVPMFIPRFSLRRNNEWMK